MKLTYDCYSEYEKCIQKLVWNYTKRSRFEFDELLSEANQAFIHAVDSYDETKGASFHTWLYITVNGKLKNYCKLTKSKEMQPLPAILNKNFDPTKKWNNNIPWQIDFIDTKEPNPEQNTTFKLLIENLSKEAKEVVDVVLNTPTEMIELVKSMSSNRQGHMHVYKSNIRAYFENKGWKNTLILNCFEEIKSTFNWR